MASKIVLPGPPPVSSLTVFLRGSSWGEGTGALRGRGHVGPQIRLEHVRKSVGHLPAWRCESLTKGLFFVCGHCFGTLGDGPATNGAEMWMNQQSGALIPPTARCEKCGGRLWPED